MINANEAIANAPKSQYYGRNVAWYFNLSRKIERFLEKLARSMEAYRKFMVRRTMKEMWKIGEHVQTDHGTGVVIKNTFLYNTFAMGGWIQTDVRYDTAPKEATSYPHVGHYNQIFLERL